MAGPIARPPPENSPARPPAAILGQRAGRDQPHHVARQRPFGAARLGRRRVLHLLDDGDPETPADQPRQIGLGLGDRHAAHWMGWPWC